MKIGNTSINVEEIADISEKDFKKLLKGRLDSDINEAWKSFQKEAKKFSVPKKKK